MKTKKYTTKLMLRIAIYSTICAAILLPFCLISILSIGRGQSDIDAMSIIFILLFIGSLFLAIFYFVVYARTKKFAITLNDDGVLIENCALKVEGARKDKIGTIRLAWSDIASVDRSYMTTPKIRTVKGELYAIDNKGEGVFGGKVWKEISLRIAK